MPSTTKLNRIMRSNTTIGFWETGMKLFISAVPFQDSMVGMLYDESAVDSVTTENLTKLATSSWALDTLWFPVTEGNSIAEVLLKLEERVNLIKGDKESMDAWHSDVCQAQHQVSVKINARKTHDIDSESLKLFRKPDYMISN